MLSLMSGLTDKPAWRDMIFDRDLIDQWNCEQLAQEGVSQNMVDWVRPRHRDLLTRYKTDRRTVSERGAAVCKGLCNVQFYTGA